MTREIEFADRWEIIVDEVRISISLLYGGILRRGIASDLILHPMLHVDFPGTEEPNFYFKVYSILIRFLQFVQYNGILRQHKVYLRGTASDYTSGYLYDWSIQKRTIVVSIQNVNINNSSHIFKAYFSLLLTIQICLWISCLLHNIGIILQIILQLC